MLKVLIFYNIKCNIVNIVKCKQRKPKNTEMVDIN